MKSVIYPGSFDPFTNGHLDLITRASKLFDRVVVAIGINSAKNPMFSIAERKEQITASCSNIRGVEVVSFDGLLVDAMDKFDVQAILRGVRIFSDFEYELQMALINRSLKPHCETIFLTPTLQNSFVASSRVKEVANLGGDISGYVPKPVLEMMNRRMQEIKSKSNK